MKKIHVIASRTLNVLSARRGNLVNLDGCTGLLLPLWRDRNDRLIFTIIFLLLASCFLLPASGLAYPNEGKDILSLGINQATGGIGITSDDRYLVTAYTENIKIVDLATFALAADQSPALSTDDSTDGNIQGLAVIPSSNMIYAAQDDGDVLSLDRDTITESISSSGIASGISLSMVAADNSTGTPTLYIANKESNYIYVYTPGSSSVSTLDVATAVAGVTFSMTDMVFVEDAGSSGELYISTDAGRVIYIDAATNAISVIDIDVPNSDDLIALDATPDGTKVYVLNTSDETVEVITTSTYAVGTPLDVSQNTGFADIIIADILDPSGYTYGFVSGQSGLSIFDTSDDDVLDFDTTNDPNTDDPLSITSYGKLAASADGYLYISDSGGEIAVITDLPYITFGTTSYIDSDSDTSAMLSSGGTVSITFSSDIAGTYEVYANGNVDQSGTLLTDTDAATSGTVEADVATTLSFTYDTNVSALLEGTSLFFVFVTDANDLVGRAAVAVTVDTPPDAITISSTSFGNERAYLIFSRLTEDDIDHYNLYADVDADEVQTKSSDLASATQAQPSSGSTMTAEISGLTNDTIYYLAVEGVDTNGNVGPRAYLLTDGTAAYAMPQSTVGPAGYSSESGCTLAGAREISNFKFQISNLWSLVLLVSGVFVLILFRSCRRRVVLFSVLGFVICFLGFMVEASAGETGVKKESPQWWSTEFKVGFWMPYDTEMGYFIPKCCNMQYTIDAAFMYQGRYGIEAGIGAMTKNGSALGSTTNEQSNDHFNLFLLPMESNLVWRADYAKRQYVIPFARGGIDYVFFRENVRGTITKGMKYGYHAGGGLQLSFYDILREPSWDEDYGINDICLTMEARYSWINNFKKPDAIGMDLTGALYSLGFMILF